VADRALRVLAIIPGLERSESFIFARRQVKHLSELGVDIRTFYLEARTSPMAMLRAARQFRRMFGEFKPDVVHAHYGTITALFALLLSSCPIAITFRGSDLNPSSEFSVLRATLSRWMSQLAALGAREIMCVSEELRGRLWWRGNRAHVIPSGIDAREFYPRPRDEARRELNWSPGVRVALFNHGAARSPNKRKHLVDAAMEIVRRQLPDARLFVFEGQISGRDVPLYINASDVVIMASRFEGSPNIVKEALACDTPICSVPVGDVPELLSSVRNCCIVEPTPEAMAAGLISLLKEPLRSNGSAYLERFSADAQCRRILGVLETASGRRPRTLGENG
jgi:glycosyltransferase involved in cell wall biosynthesis